MFQTASFVNNGHVVCLPSLRFAPGGRHGLTQKLECSETSQGWLQHWTPNTCCDHLRCAEDPLPRLSRQKQNRCTELSCRRSAMVFDHESLAEYGIE